jgi:hypothetical protein
MSLKVSPPRPVPTKLAPKQFEVIEFLVSKGYDGVTVQEIGHAVFAGTKMLHHATKGGSPYGIQMYMARMENSGLVDGRLPKTGIKIFKPTILARNLYAKQKGNG